MQKKLLLKIKFVSLAILLNLVCSENGSADCECTCESTKGLPSWNESVRNNDDCVKLCDELTQASAKGYAFTASCK